MVPDSVTSGPATRTRSRSGNGPRLSLHGHDMSSFLTGKSWDCALGLQIAQYRSYLYTLGPKVGIIYILGALGVETELRTIQEYQAISYHVVAVILDVKPCPVKPGTFVGVLKPWPLVNGYCCTVEAESWNMTFLQSQSTRRMKTSMNHPACMFQLCGVCCNLPDAEYAALP